MPQNVAQFGMLLLLVVGRLMIYAAFRGQEPETAKTSGCFRKPVAISGPFVLPQLLQLLQTVATIASLHNQSKKPQLRTRIPGELSAHNCRPGVIKLPAD